MSDVVVVPVALWRRVWERCKPWQPAVAFVGGFLWDWLTLRRIDRIVDNLTLLGYLIVLGMLLVLSTRIGRAPERWPRLAGWLGWIDYGAQFFFGGLYSAYVIFYFKSASGVKTFLFLGFLAFLLVANEFLEHRLRFERLRWLLYCLCSFNFLLFFIPVVTGFLGRGIFTIAALGALAATMAVSSLAWFGVGYSVREEYRRHIPGWFLLLSALFIVDALGLIPPVPLALMGGGFYHDVAKAPDGYQLVYEAPPWYAPWRDDDRVFHWREGDRIFCFTAIFAPNGTALDVVHVWEHYDEKEGWAKANAIPFDVKGGREGGFRGYTAKRNVAPGEWRVKVQTPTGRELGRLFLTVDASDTAPLTLTSRLYE